MASAYASFLKILIAQLRSSCRLMNSADLFIFFPSWRDKNSVFFLKCHLIQPWLFHSGKSFPVNFSPSSWLPLLRLHAKTRRRFVYLVGSLMYLAVLLHAPLKLPTAGPDGEPCSRSRNVNANSQSTSPLGRRGKQMAQFDLFFFFFPFLVP